MNEICDKPTDAPSNVLSEIFTRNVGEKPFPYQRPD